jgi:hypothetical protein
MFTYRYTLLFNHCSTYNSDLYYCRLAKRAITAAVRQPRDRRRNIVRHASTLSKSVRHNPSSLVPDASRNPAELPQTVWPFVTPPSSMHAIANPAKKYLREISEAHVC